MDAAVLVARLLLAAVFALAAVTKLRDRSGTARAIGDFGVNRRYARPAALLLPLLELAVAGAMLIDPLAQAAPVGALVLLGLFTLAIVNALRRSRPPDCGCFGNLTSEPVSGWTAGRNAVLGVVALFVALRGPGASLAAPLELLIVVAVVTAAVLLGERRGQATEPSLGRPAAPRPERRGIALGQPAPDFELSGPCEAEASLGSLRRAGLPIVLMFLDGSCGSCEELHPHLHRWQVTLAERVAIAVVMTGGAEAAKALCTGYGVENVLVDNGAEPLWKSYSMPGAPSGVAVAPDGSVASAAVAGPDALEELVRQTIRHSAQWTQPSAVA